jgi:hypothetical protein
LKDDYLDHKINEDFKKNATVSQLKRATITSNDLPSMTMSYQGFQKFVDSQRNKMISSSKQSKLLESIFIKHMSQQGANKSTSSKTNSFKPHTMGINYNQFVQILFSYSK